MIVYAKCECFVMQTLYVCLLCASCSSSQCCVMHDLYYRFIVRFPIGLDFLFITFTFLLHLLLSWISYLSDSDSIFRRTLLGYHAEGMHAIF